MDDKPADISHLVFVIHGIGQKMETGNIVKRSKECVLLHILTILLISLWGILSVLLAVQQDVIRICLAEDLSHGPLGFKGWTCPEIDIILYDILHEIWQVQIVSDWVLCTLLATKYIQPPRNCLLSAQSIKIGTTSYIVIIHDMNHGLDCHIVSVCLGWERKYLRWKQSISVS